MKSWNHNLSFGDFTACNLLHKFTKKIRMHELLSLLLRYMVSIKGEVVFVAAYTFVTACGRLNHYLFLWFGKNETLFFETINQKRDLRIFFSENYGFNWEIIKGPPSVIVKKRMECPSFLTRIIRWTNLDNLEDYLKCNIADAFDSLVW